MNDRKFLEELQKEASKQSAEASIELSNWEIQTITNSKYIQQKMIKFLSNPLYVPFGDDKTKEYKITIDLAKHNSGVCISDGIDIETLSLNCVDDFFEFVKFLDEWGKFKIIVEISNNFSGKYNSALQNQLIGVLIAFLKSFFTDYELQIIYPSQWMNLYPQYKENKKFIDKKERIKKVKEDFSINVSNDDEADAFLMLNVFNELWEKSKKNKKIIII